VSPKDSAAVRSREEIADAIRAFTSAQWARLRKIASRYGGQHIMPDDLLQEAFRRAFEDEESGRNCPVDVDIVKFLAEAMRSISGGEWERAKTRPPLVVIAQSGHQERGGEDPGDPALNTEELLSRDQHAASIRKHVLSLFDDDQQARDIVEGTMEGFSADELRTITGLNKIAYASKRRLIRRRIDNEYPEGWKL
jgi:DNA-directed RNA polymerase specialized sigma24 family protein